MNGASEDSRMPRGVLAVVVIGLLACVAAALLTTGKGEGEWAHLEWVQVAPFADSKPVAVPGSSGQMQLVSNGIRATGLNVSGYSLFRVASMLRIDAGSPVGSGRILCEVKGAGGAEIAQTSGGLRATYPRSSEGLYTQEVPETLIINFSSHSSELSVVEVQDLPSPFASERGVKLEWPKYTIGTEHLLYFLPAGKPVKDLELPFDTVWKTTDVPAAHVACTLTTGAGKATVQASGSLKKVSEPINEEAEAEKEEEEE